MNKIQRLVFTLACLLTTLGGYADDNYKIVELNASAGGTVSAKMGSTSIIAGTTNISYNTWITLEITCNDGYYLQSLEWEEVAELGWAESRRRVPGFTGIHSIDILAWANQTVLGSNPQKTFSENHFAGEYTNCFQMPKNNVIVRAAFGSLKSFSNAEQTNITTNFSGGTGTETYNGNPHTLSVKDAKDENNIVTLSEGVDYKITDITFNTVSKGANHTIQAAGTYVVTLEGIGNYQGSKASGNMIITTKTLHVTADAKSKTYGEVDPELTYTYVGSDLVAGDENVITGSLTRVEGENVIASPYYIIRKGTLAAENYDISFTEAALRIDPKPIGSTATVTHSALSFNYDANADQYATITSVNDGSRLLTSGTDYDVTYTSAYFNSEENNAAEPYNKRRPDIHYMTITFKGNYTGTKVVRYQVRKEILLSNDHRWITYYDPLYNTYVPEGSGFEVYTIKNITNTGIELHERRDFIKAGVPVLIYRTDNTVSFFPELVENCDAGISSNDAYIGVNTGSGKAVSSITGSDYDIWILVDGQFVRTNSGTIPDGKCYLKLPQADFYTPSLALSRTFTGIDPIKNKEMKDAMIYDPSGRRVSNPQKGLYIQNGKKIIIK